MSVVIDGITFTGDNSNDVEVGTDNNDFLDGRNGSDTLSGRGGDDVLQGGNNGDTLDGDNGNDRLFGENGNDKLLGGNDADTLFGGRGDDELFGENGADTLDGGPGNDIMTGGNREDVFVAGNRNDIITDFDFDQGDSIEIADEVLDIVVAEAAGDRVLELGKVVIETEAGPDGLKALIVDLANDGVPKTTAFAQDGGIKIVLGDNASGSHTNSITLEDFELSDAVPSGFKFIESDFADFVSGGNDTVQGTEFNDRIKGGNGSDFIDGNGGNDTLRGGNNGDHLKGGNGNDTLFGDNGSDKLLGGNDGDMLFGGRGDDELFGENGSDRLDGGTGSDTLTGGLSADTFVFSGGTGSNIDTITDFQDNIDKIEIEAALIYDQKQVGSDVVITLTTDDKIVVENITDAQLDDSDFVFV
ncbi:MAG: calcium-binding protein [Pseudomonadota bacterium]